MTFPAKVFLCFAVSFSLAVGLFFAAAQGGIRRAYVQMQADALTAASDNVQRELDRGAEDAARRVGLVAESEATMRMALDLSRPQPDFSMYANDAVGAARTHGLELCEFVSDDGTVISSAQAPERIGRKEDWIPQAAAGTPGKAFLRREEIDGIIVITQVVVRMVPVGEKKLYIAGGRRLDYRLLQALPLAAGMRALLFVDPDGKCSGQTVYDAEGTVVSAGGAAPFLTQICRNPGAPGTRPFPYAGRNDAETYSAVPLTAPDHTALGAALVVYSGAAELAAERSLRGQLLMVLALGFAIGALLSYWGAVSLARPLARLARSAREIAALAPHVHAAEKGGPEVAALAQALNEAAEKLAAERERLMQVERITAWREMTLRLTAEIESALDQLAEGRRAGDVSEAVANFHRLLDRFREFGELLVLPMHSVQLNDVVRTVLSDLEPLFYPTALGLARPPVSPEVALAEDLPLVHGDSAVLARAVDTFLLYAVYSMPAGGTLVVRTDAMAAFVRLQIVWPGSFSTEEEAKRLFSPNPVKRTYVTGLELATAQAIVVGHGGSVRTENSGGTSRILIQIPVEAKGQPSPEPARVAESLARIPSPQRPG
jgi:signal transduction histidine kinase